jgi:NACHT domain
MANAKILLSLSVATAIFVSLVLAGYAIYVRIRQSTYTEKRFNFVALWACTSLTATTISMFAFPIDDILFHSLGLELHTNGNEKLIVPFLVLGYIYFISNWAKHWNGLKSVQFPKQPISFLYFIHDGITETVRIATGRAPVTVSGTAHSTLNPQLPEPITPLLFHEQAREIAMARWPEFIIRETDWISDAQCWKATDTALTRPTLIICAPHSTDPPLGRIEAQIRHFQRTAPVRLIVIYENSASKAPLPIASSNLIDSQELYTFDELVISSLPLARYSHTIRRQFSEDRIANSAFTLSETYVDTEVTSLMARGHRLQRSSATISFRDYFNTWLAESSKRQIALLGEYGQGKSSEALALSHRLLSESQSFQSEGFRLPILIRLTGLSPKTTSPEELLGAWGASHGLNGRALLALHRAGRTVLIFDAFDEMANVSDRADRFDHFSSLWRFACPDSKLIFTGRPNFFLDDEELKRALGIADSTASGPFCSAVKITPFSTRQIAGALRWLPKRRVRRFLRLLSASPVLAELASRPSLLFQIAQLWRQDKISLKSDRLSSANVTRAFITYSLERQVEKQRVDLTTAQPDKQFIFLRQSELDAFTQAISVSALVDGRNNAIPETVMAQVVENLLEQFKTFEFERRPIETGALAMPLSVRLADKPNPVEACVHAVRTHGVIEHDPTKTGQYRFSHKSFAEVLAAEALVQAAFKPTSVILLSFSPSQRRQLVAQESVFRFVADFVFNNPNEPVRVSGFSVVRLFYPTSMGALAGLTFAASVSLGAVLGFVLSPLLLATSKIKSVAFDGLMRLSSSMDHALLFWRKRNSAQKRVAVAEFDEIEVIVSLEEYEHRVLRQARIFARVLFGIIFFGALAVATIEMAQNPSLSAAFKNPSVIILNTAGFIVAVSGAFLSSRIRFRPFNDAVVFSYMLDKLSRSRVRRSSYYLHLIFSGGNTLDSLVERRLSDIRFV